DPTGDGDGDGDPTGDGDGDPTGDCEPQADAYAAFGVQDIDEGQELDWDLLCTLDGVGPGDSESGYLLALSDCVSQNGGDDQPLVELFIDSNPSTEPIPLVEPGTSLHLRYVAVPPFIPGKWFTLRSEPGGYLLLAGFDGPSLTPWNVDDFDYAPL